MGWRSPNRRQAPMRRGIAKALMRAFTVATSTPATAAISSRLRPSST